MNAITGGIQAAVESGKEYNRTLEQSMIGFETLLGSKSAAIQHIKELEAFALKTPFTSSELFKLSPMLQGVGFAAKDVIPILTSVGNALAATGNSQSLERVIRQLGQMQAKGRVSFEEMNVLAENGIAAWRMLAEAIAKPGENVEELQAKLMHLGETGQLMSKDVMPVLFGSFDKKYGGAMERVALTTQFGVKSSEEDIREKIAGEGLRGTTEFDFTGGAYGAETERSRKRTEALQGERGDQLRGMVGSFGGKYGAATDYVQDQMLSPMGGREQFLNFFGKLTDGTMGENIVKPMLDSLRNGAAAAGQAAASLGQSIYKGLNDIWQWGSPSKKAQQLGEWIAEGLEMGLNKTQAGRYANLKRLATQSPEFVKKLVAESAKRGIDANDLLNVMSLETAGTFSPSITNPWGYTGLIQFGKSAAKDLGTTTGALRQMSAVDQLDYVFKYLDQHLKGLIGKGPIGASQLYAAIGAGSASLDPNKVHFREGSKAYKLNKGSWDVNKDGQIQQWEFGVGPRNHLGAGVKFGLDSLGVSKSNPMPVQIVGPSIHVDSNYQDPVMLQQMKAAQSNYAARRSFGTLQQQDNTPGTIHDAVPVIVDVLSALEPITDTFNELGVATSITLKPLKELLDVEKEMAKFHEAEGIKSGAAARLRAQVDGAGKKKKGREDAFSREGVASDFDSGLTSVLANLGWEKPMSLAKQFGIGLLRDVQGRMAQDMSAMITGSIFGKRGEDGKMTGGLFGGSGFNLGSIFGKLFGGFRASGGSMSAGRFYVAGENGPEIVTGPGYVHNNRESRQMMGGSDSSYTIVAIGDREVGRAVDAYRSTPRGRRARVIEGKYMRLITAHT